MTIVFFGSAPSVDVKSQGLHQVQSNQIEKNINESINLMNDILKSDVYENSDKKETEALKIGLPRILFQRLKQEQVDAVNESRKLPKNAKLRDNALGGMYLSFNICDFYPGTHTLHAGYEVKNDILGFTHVVREGTQAWFLKK